MVGALTGWSSDGGVTTGSKGKGCDLSARGERGEGNRGWGTKGQDRGESGWGGDWARAEGMVEM